MSPTVTGMAGARVLVTGGAGFIGSHLVEGLLRAGASRVLVADDLSLGRRGNLSSVLGRPEVAFEPIDCADLASLWSLVEGEELDLCFNLAVIPLPHSLEHPQENVNQNVAMTSAVCELQRRGRFRRLIQFSSSEVYGTAQVVPMNENHPLCPHTPYAAAKAATDLVALSYAGTFGLETVIVRPFNTYGERQNELAYAGVIPLVVRRVLAGEPVQIHGDGEQTRDFTHVSDTVTGALSAAVRDEAMGETFNLGQGAEVSVNDLVAAILSALDRQDHPVEHVQPRPGDVRRLLADTTKAREALDYRPQVSLTDGITRTVEWYVTAAVTDRV